MDTNTPTPGFEDHGDRYVQRHPGVHEIERLFPSPVAMGKGSLALEGGVSVVAGPGMGKSTLFEQLAARLRQDRGLTTCVIGLPLASDYREEAGFYAFLGELTSRIRGGLANSSEPALASALANEPEWDGPGSQSMTPRGFERFITRLAQAAVHTPGICLLFDEVDQVGAATWKGPFISALRFVFQTSSGITPLYALWTLFGDESLPGSNYFRNVTRPIFLEPLDHEGRVEIIRQHLPDLSSLTQTAVAQIAGGHPLLLHRIASDLAAQVPTAPGQASLLPAHVDVALGADRVAAQRQLVADLLSRSGALATALSDLRRKRPAYAGLPRGLVASGFVDHDDAGGAVLSGRVLEVVP